MTANSTDDSDTCPFCEHSINRDHHSDGGEPLETSSCTASECDCRIERTVRERKDTGEYFISKWRKQR